MSNTDSTNSESLPLNDVLQNHLTGCEQCQSSVREGERPVANVNGTPKLCAEWFRIIREWSAYEGKVNNIVAHDEFGNEAFHHGN